MNLKEVIFGVLLLLAFTSNFNFFYSYNEDFSIANIIFLSISIFFNLVVTLKKMNDDHQLGAVFLSTSVVALIQLIVASCILFYSEYYGILDQITKDQIVSLSGGALLANSLSIIMYVIYTLKHRV